MTRLYWLIEPEMSQSTTRLGQRGFGLAQAMSRSSPPWRCAARKVRRRSMRRPSALASARREGIGVTGSASRSSIRLARAISCVLICSKSRLRRRSSADMVTVESTSISIPSSVPSRPSSGRSAPAPSSSASAARFSADCAVRSSCTPRMAGSIIAIMCSM